MYKRIVVKVGTGVISNAKGQLDEGVLKGIVDQIVHLREKKVEVVLVTSGAVGGSSSGAYGSPAFAGTWSDITALFSRPTTIATVAAAGSQYVQAESHLDARHIRITFTPTSGTGNVFVNCFRKNWSH